MNSKLIIVSNRLPYKATDEAGEIKYKKTEGGLSTGLASLLEHKDHLWIGWSGLDNEDPQVTQAIRSHLINMNLLAVHLSREEIEGFYTGFSNSTLWPVCHYFPTLSSFNNEQWEIYKEVNQKYADTILEVAAPGDVVWIHDFHLMLVPRMVKEALPDIQVSYFHHIPFPSFDVFRIIPQHKELINGLLYADHIGFHTDGYKNNFAGNVLQLFPEAVLYDDIIDYHGSYIRMGSYPMGIDYHRFQLATELTVTRLQSARLKNSLGNRKIILSVDRLDYSKGILDRLNACEAFLQQYQQYIGKVTFVFLIVPSREDVTEYANVKEEINKKIGAINGLYSSVDWQPVCYLYRSLSFERLCTLYYTADIAMVTPLRDGMNLVCKEYIACRKNKDGVLILSELTGAAIDLKEAVIVNPYDQEEITNAVYQALEMSKADQKQRMAALQERVKRNDIRQWFRNIMQGIRHTGVLQNI